MNALTTFQDTINDVHAPSFDVLVMAYLDVILISPTF